MEQKQYTGRRMRKNHSNALPRYIIAYATEVENKPDETNHRRSNDVFTRGSIISCRLEGTEAKQIRPRILHSPQEFWQQIEKFSAANYTTWVVGHSILHSLLVSGVREQFEEAKFVIDWPRSKRKRENNDEDDPHSSALVIIGNPPTIVACRCVGTGGRIAIVDLLNWFPASLDEIDDTLGRDNGDFRSAISGHADINTPSMKTAGTVLATFLRLMSWSRENDVGMFRYTAASQAMSAYRHRFMTEEIFVHDNMPVKNLERHAHYGGRTEIFRYGNFQEKMHQLDVNSLFPSVMATGLFPTKLERYQLTSRWSQNLPPIDWSRSVANVWIKTSTPYYPVRFPQGIVYPIGEFGTTLCGEELKYAFDSGDLQSVQSWSEYSVGRIFSAWVEYMWRLRSLHAQSGDAVYAKLVKLMLNGLYGKFAQRGAKWINCANQMDVVPWQEWTETDCRTSQNRRFRSFGYQKQEYVGEQELVSTFVAVSSFVTAAARMRMNLLREVAGPHNVYYQGVDGLIVTDEGRGRLDHAGEICEGELGKLRHQLTVDEAEILGYCDYRLGTKKVKSGLSGNAIVLPDGELLQQLAHVQDSLFSLDQRTGVSKVATTWHRQAQLVKGYVDANRWVQPFQFDRIMPTSSDMDDSVSCNNDAASSIDSVNESASPPNQPSTAESNAMSDSSLLSP